MPDKPTQARMPVPLAYYGIPMLFCLAVHFRALQMWFGNDDFAWLGLPQMVHSPRDLVDVLFQPMAQGTVRVISERLYFLTFASIFGINALPFRIWVFLTQFANIALIAWITRRITGSTVAGFLAPILWSANCCLALALGWSSAYNEICFAFFFLLSFFLLLKYIDTGQRRYWIAQWVTFILGFGALELMVMYPVVSSAYLFCCARKHFRRSLALLIPSIIFTALHFGLSPRPSDPYYRMYFDGDVFSTIATYWRVAVSASRTSVVDWRPEWLGLAAAIAITAALLAFVIHKLRRRDWAAPFLLAWFFIVLAPVIPLKKHITEYYMTVPAIGLAMLAAWGIASAARRGPAIKAIAAILVLLYFALSITDIASVDRYYYDHYRRMHRLIAGLTAAHKTNPVPVVLLSGIDDDLFWSGFYDDPFRLIGVEHVYLTPGAESGIAPHPEWGGTSHYLISLDDAVQALKTKRAEVYSVEDTALRRTTELIRPYLYQQYLDRHQNFVDAGDPLFRDRLGSTWYRAEDGYRWMPKTATLRLAGPKSASDMLYITGYCPSPLLAKGPVQVTFRANGLMLGSEKLAVPNQFQLRLRLPGQLLGEPTIQISIDVNRTAQILPDIRPLGLIFGTFTIK